MRVGVVTTSFPRHAGDHAGNFVAAHVAELLRAGHTVEVIAAGDGAPDDLVVERVAGGDMFYAGGAPDFLERSPMRGLASAASFSARLTAAVARRAPTWDAIVAHWLPSALAALGAQALSPLAALPSALASIASLRRLPLGPAAMGFAGQLAPTRKPLLAIAHGGDVHTLRRAGLLGGALHALHAADARLVFVSDELRAIAITAAPRLRTWLANARVQPMGIDTTHFASLPRRRTDPPTVACVARMVPVKGVDVLVDALAHVEAPMRVVFAGEGPEREAIIARAQRVLAERRALERGGASTSNATTVTRIVHHGHVHEYRARVGDSNLFDVGFLDAHERDHVFTQASVVVIPSRIVKRRTEGAPVIALEALAAGIPIVASAVGGLRELAARDPEQRAIRLVAPEDPCALAAAIDASVSAPPDPEYARSLAADRDWCEVATYLMPDW